jgi:periplasmic protein TonB
MNAEHILRSDVLDIIFENRNKQYGAYELRRQYDKRLYKALGITLGLVLSLVVWNYIQHNWNSNDNIAAAPFEIKDSTVLVKIYEEPEKPKPQQEKPPASAKVTVPRIVPDKDAPDTIPTIDDIKDKVISDVAVEGPPATSDVQTAAPETPTGTGTAPVPEPAEPDIFVAPEVYPEFPGGTSALLRFLGKHLQVPEEAMEAGQRVKVPVKFVVNKEGVLSDIEFPVPANEAFLKEIKRVMSKMPRWKPGSQHGRPVSVYFTIPIIFEIPEN